MGGRRADDSFDGTTRCRVVARWHSFTLRRGAHISVFHALRFGISVDNFCGAIGFGVMGWRQLRDCSSEVTRSQRFGKKSIVREVALGHALDAFFAADGWRRLGYATAAQYARERLGTSLSSIKAKRRLAKRLCELRFLADALERGELGYEAARLVAEVATRATVEAWVRCLRRPFQRRP